MKQDLSLSGVCISRCLLQLFDNGKCYLKLGAWQHILDCSCLQGLNSSNGGCSSVGIWRLQISFDNAAFSQLFSFDMCCKITDFQVKTDKVSDLSLRGF